MRTKKLLSVLVTLVTVASCSTKTKQQEVKVYNLQEIIATNKTITLKEMGAKVSEVKLEKPEGVPFAEGWQFVEDANHYYLRHSTPNYIARYDKDGNFINIVARRGRAKNEYNFVRDYIIREDSNIDVYDKEHIKIYTPEGEYLGEVHYPHFNEELKVNRTSGNLVTFRYSDDRGNLFSSFECRFGVEKYELALQNSTRDTIYTKANSRPFQLEPKGRITPSNTTHLIYKSSNEIIYRTTFSDSVFTFNYDKLMLEPRYVFKNSNGPTIDDFKIGFSNVYDNKTVIMEVLETSKHILLKIKEKDEQANQNPKARNEWYFEGNWYALDKATSKSYKLDLSVEDALGKDFDFFPEWIGKDKFVCYWDEAMQPDPTLIIVEFDK